MTRRLVTLRWILLLGLIKVLSVEGQNYAERSGNLHANDIFAVTENDEDYYSLDYSYDWSHTDSQLRRWNVEEYPHPQSEHFACHRKTPSNICDPDDILGEQQANDLDISIRRIYNGTICICPSCNQRSGGIQIGIALLKHTYRPYNEHPSKIIQSFSKNLRSKWRLGECEDDLLIVVVTEDRQSFTDVGSTTKQFISLREAFRIFLENKAHFTDGKYFEGLQGMLENYYETTRNLARDKDNKSTRKLKKGEIIGIIITVILTLFLLIVITVFFYKKYKRIEDSGKQRSKTNILSRRFKRRNEKEYKKCDTEENAAHVTNVNPDDKNLKDNSLQRNSEITTSSDQISELHEDDVIYGLKNKPKNDSTPWPLSQPTKSDNGLNECTVTVGEKTLSLKTFSSNASPQFLQTDM